MVDKALFSSATGEWATPQDFFDLLNEQFKFDLDAAATTENAKCEKFYTKKDDALSIEKWDGKTIWLNCPYGRRIGEWIAKSREQSSKYSKTVVLLLPARTDTKWFHEYIANWTCEIYLIRGRLKFGGSANSAPFPSMVVVMQPYDFEVKPTSDRFSVFKSKVDVLEY